MDSNNPYTGKRITLISNSLLRYEGTLISVNPDDATVGLAKVRIFGTEDRPAPNFVPPSNNVFDSVLFRGTDIREIALINEEPAPFVDPAVLEIHQPSAQPAPATASFTQPSVFPAASASQREASGSGGNQSSGTFAHLTSTISPRGAQPSSFGSNQNQSTASSAQAERPVPDRDADRFSSRQANASQRPPFANATNTTSAGAVAPSSRGNESSKRTDAQSALGKSQQPASAPKPPSTWANVVTSVPKAPRGSSSSNSQNELEGNSGRPRDEHRGRPQRGSAPQEQRAAGSARGGEFSSQRGGRTSFLDRDRDRPTYNYAPRGGANSWSRGGGGGGGDREEFGGGRRQGGLVGRGGGNDYAAQSAGQRGGFGFGFGFGYNAPQNSRGYGHREAYSAGPARGQSSWTRGGAGAGAGASGGASRDVTRTDWRAPGPRGADSRKAAGVPAEYQEEFDFESGNTQLAHELEKLHLDGQGPKDNEGAKVSTKDERGDAEAADLGNASGSEDEGSTQDSESHYDKRKSFFDSISSEVSATNKKPNWHKERQVNAETFGQAALRRGGGRGGRGRGGWRGPRRGGYGFNNY